MATILIVDDRPTNREYLTTLLGYGGHRLFEAADGAEALETVKTMHLDLVIADILMPTMDGLEFVRQLRADPAVAGTPVIFFTAHYHEKEARALADACGVAHILSKPCEPEVVLRTVDAALGVAPAPAPPVPTEDFDREHLRLLTDKLSQKADEANKTNERLSALVELGLQLGSELDPRKLLKNFCHAARSIIGARCAIVGVLDEAGSPLRYLFTSGMDAEAAARLGSPDPRQGALRTVVSEGRCLRLNNADGDPVALGFSSSHPPVHAWLGAPIASPTRIYGWLGLIDKIGAETFSDEDERLAGILAAQAGRVYENGSLYADLRRRTADLELEVGERQRTEASLKESEERFRQLAENIHEVFWLSDPVNGKILYVGPAYEAVWGRTCESLYASPRGWLEAIHGEDRERVREAFLTKQVAGQYDEVYRIIHTDGSIRWIHDRGFPVRDAAGAVYRVAGVAEDVTERKQAEEALRAAERRMQHVVASSPAVLYTLALEEGRIRGISWMSDNIQESLGYSVQETHGADWWMTNIHPEDREVVLARVDQELFTGGYAAHEYRFRHRDGTYRWIRDQHRLVRDAGGQLIEVVGAWLDVTERKKLEDQFRQAQKMEAVGRLAGGVAHDFNNLLQVITGYGELLLDTLRRDDPSRELVGEMTRAGDRAAALTRQLLAFSRQSVLAPKVLDLNAVVLDMETMMRRMIGEDVDLAARLQPGLGRVKADPGQLEQVLMNLAVNARDAMPQGGRLTIETRDAALDEEYARLHAGVRPGHYVLLAVSDTGCGMTPEIQARIFEPFFTTKEKGQGTGLGLATVFGIVQQAGGHVAVYSEPGVGTSFKVYLPRVEESAPRAKSRSVVLAPPKGTETVLLVEDEDAVRSLTRIVLRGAGYHVLEASDGAEALDLAGRHEGPIHLLLTDVVMPVLGGRQLAERLLVLHPEMKVLFQSGYTDDAVVRHGVLQEKVHFLQKPFTPLALAMKMREVLDEA